MNNYYNEIELVIKRHEINKRARVIEENNEVLRTNWEMGKLIVEAQGGSTRAKYGNELIKEWSDKLTKLYGKGYDKTNIKLFRSFYLLFPKSYALRNQLNWTMIRTILPIKEENRRNYYINKCIENNLSSRELIKEIKSNSYERILDKPDKIEIISPRNKIEIRNNIMNPIIFELKENEKIQNEHDLEMKILSDFQDFARQLGNSFTLVGNQVKIIDNKEIHILDILLFNIDFNKYIVIELKNKEITK